MVPFMHGCLALNSRRFAFLVLIVIILLLIYLIISETVFNSTLRGLPSVRKGLELPPLVCKEENGEFEFLQRSRKASINNVCKSHYNRLFVKEFIPKLRLFKHLQYERNHDLINCPVWKAMTTAVDAMLLHMSGEPIHDAKIKSVAHKTFTLPENFSEVQEVVNRATKLIIVRHPFDRLLSCYLDKIVRRKRPMFYVYLRGLIKERYRLDPSNDGPPTFPEFVNYIIDYFKVQNDKPLTWDDKTYDWMPAYYLCGVCNVEYDIVMKYENYEWEKVHLYRLLNLTKDYFGDKIYHVGNVSALDARAFYYSQLSEQQMQKLESAYKFDLTMFNYCTDSFKFY